MIWKTYYIYKNGVTSLLDIDTSSIKVAKGVASRYFDLGAGKADWETIVDAEPDYLFVRWVGGTGKLVLSTLDSTAINYHLHDFDFMLDTSEFALYFDDNHQLDLIDDSVGEVIFPEDLIGGEMPPRFHPQNGKDGAKYAPSDRDVQISDETWNAVKHHLHEKPQPVPQPKPVDPIPRFTPPDISAQERAFIDEVRFRLNLTKVQSWEKLHWYARRILEESLELKSASEVAIIGKKHRKFMYELLKKFNMKASDSPHFRMSEVRKKAYKKRRADNEPTRQQIQNLYREGYSIDEIMEQTDFSRAHIGRAISAMPKSKKCVWCYRIFEAARQSQFCCSKSCYTQYSKKSLRRTRRRIRRTA